MNNKKILIFNSSQENMHPIIVLFEELAKKNYSISLASPESYFALYFIKNKWPYQKIYLGPENKKKFNKITFFLVLPFLYFKFFIFLAYKKLKKSISIIICVDSNEKIIITPLAKILKIKIIWIEDIPIFSKNKIIKKSKYFFCFFLCREAKIIVFNESAKEFFIKNRFKPDNIHNIQPAIKLNLYEHQENIFSELAQNESSDYKRKFFTIGTVADLDKKQKIETIFSAVKICLAIIPNIQLIIIGDGKERKNLNWLAQKMGIDHITWFVGTQGYLKKWLDSFDLFITSNESSKLSDFDTILKTMSSETPILAQHGIGLEEIIPSFNDFMNFFNENDHEMLAGQIIKLRHDKILRKNLGQLEKKHLEKNFLINKQIEKIEIILNS